MNILVIDKLSGIKFEKFVKEFLGDLGFSSIDFTKEAGDFGVDLVAFSNGKRMVIQCKRHTRAIGIKAIQEVVSGKSYYFADNCMVISNREYTASAIKLAKRCNCRLIGRNDLKSWLNKKFSSSEDFLRFVKDKRLKKFKISTDRLVSEYFALKNKLKKQPTVSDIDKQGKFSSVVYRRRWGTWNNFLVAIKEKPINVKNISKENLIRDYRRVKKSIGKVPTRTEINKFGKYSGSTYERAFGSWNRFLESVSENLNKKHLIKEEEFINEFKRVKKKIGHTPTTQEMRKYGRIASNSYKRIWGSWTNFLNSMGEDYQKRNIPEENLLEEYLKLKKLLKKDSLTQRNMNEYGKYSSSVYERRYGGWNKFLRHVGDEVNVNKNIQEKELVSDYFRIKKFLNKPKLSANDIKKHGKYSISTYLKHFGKWNNFLKQIREIE